MNVKGEALIYRGENKEIVATLDDTCNVTVSGCRYEQTIRTQSVISYVGLAALVKSE